MRIELPFLVNKFGLTVRIAFVLTIGLFYLFGLPGFDDACPLALPGMRAVIAGCLFCVVSFGVTRLVFASSISTFVLVLASTIGYLYLVCGSYYAQFFGPLSTMFPVLVLEISLVFPILGTREFDDFAEDDDSLLIAVIDGSAGKFLNYYLSRFSECWIQCHLFAAAVNLLRCTIYVAG